MVAWLLGCFLAVSPARAEAPPAPWHRWGEFTFSAGAGLSHYSDYVGASALVGVGLEYEVLHRNSLWLHTEVTRTEVDADRLAVVGVTASLVLHD